MKIQTLGRALALLALCSFALSSCAVAVLGAGAAAAWSATGPDVVETTINRPYNETFDLAMQALDSWQGGPPKVIDRENYFLFADYDGTEVRMGFRIEPPTTIVRIMARKGYGTLPSRDTAEALATAIYEASLKN